MKKTKFYLTAEEQRYILHSLNALKTKPRSAGQYTDTVDDAMLAVMRGKVKRVKIA
ncbi:hypothetical protein AGMMS49992_03160 [Clostridia bacterium]|nr:hypothetical protein AGMMS49992_03160 [Clostridia bacterium]